MLGVLLYGFLGFRFYVYIGEELVGLFKVMFIEFFGYIYFFVYCFVFYDNFVRYVIRKTFNL